MTHLASFLRRLALATVLIAVCATITESSVTDRERRHVGTEQSSHRSGKQHASGTSGTTNNEITAEPGRKVSHRLIGGHLRFDTKSRDGGESLWDDGILMSAAGNGKEEKNARGGGGGGSGGDDEDEKKTLSQQVKEGKYGLIQNEIYGERPKRPGIISYLGNPEVPRDTIDNLGGLDEEEIWLAENHVLVLRGGNFPEHEQDGQQTDDANWPPIDDYKAPQRQVKIPARPRIPPPFPVQLTDGGPVQLIGPNGTAENIDINGTLDHNATPPFYAKGVLPGGEEPFFTPNGTIFTPDFGPPRNLSVEEKSSRGHERKGVKSEPQQPPVGFPPFYHAIPPGAVFVPPPSNQSDYDEEDQSIYYPPPYSFYYPQDNTTAVPPGPLVPGIILPPPPDFFSALDDKKTTTKKYTKRPPETTPSSPKSRPTYLPPRKVTTKQYKTSTVLPSSIIKVTSSSSSISAKTSYDDRTTINATNTFTPKRTVEITTETSGKPHTLENTEKYTISPVIGNQVSEATTQQKDWSTLTSKIPVLAYYPSTTQPSLERHVEVTPASIKSIITTSQPGRSSSHASYYFYEEPADGNSAVTTNPPPVYYETTTTTTARPPSYYSVDGSRPTEQKKHYYAVETITPVETPKDYKVKLIDSIVKNSHTYQYSDDDEVAKYHTGSPRDQGQRMLADQAPVFYQSPARPNHVPLQTYYTTPKPQTYYRQSAKPKPIYQYSFQIADYPKHDGNQGSLYNHREQQQQQNAQYSEYQDVKSGNQQYDYEDIDNAPRQSPPRKRVLYKTQHPVYPTSTAYPIVDTTSNPQHAYFTQQDEKLLDDVTKEYFTIFGKKLQEAGGSTTPIYGKSSSVTEKPIAHDVINAYAPNTYNTGRPVVAYKTPHVKVHYGDQSERPYSLKDDTLVNYRRPLPPLEPESEFIEVIAPKLQPQPSPLPGYKLTEGYRVQSQRVPQHSGPTSRYRLPGTIQTTSGHANNFVPLSDSREELENVEEPASLFGDIDVNYRNPRPAINPDAEFIDPVTVQDNPNAYFAYRLPGDVGHFYFLTPQAITQRQDQNGGYVYPKPRVPRLRRRPGNV